MRMHTCTVRKLLAVAMGSVQLSKQAAALIRAFQGAGSSLAVCEAQPSATGYAWCVGIFQQHAHVPLHAGCSKRGGGPRQRRGVCSVRCAC
jgi:hypothetical protein